MVWWMRALVVVGFVTGLAALLGFFALVIRDTSPATDANAGTTSR